MNRVFACGTDNYIINKDGSKAYADCGVSVAGLAEGFANYFLILFGVLFLMSIIFFIFKKITKKTLGKFGKFFLILTFILFLIVLLVKQFIHYL